VYVTSSDLKNHSFSILQKQNWLSFLFIARAAALKEQTSTILSTNSTHIYASQHSTACHKCKSYSNVLRICGYFDICCFKAVALLKFIEATCVTSTRFVTIRQTVATIWQCFYFQDGGRPPSWICYTRAWTTHAHRVFCGLCHWQDSAGMIAVVLTICKFICELGLKMSIRAAKIGVSVLRYDTIR